MQPVITVEHSSESEREQLGAAFATLRNAAQRKRNVDVAYQVVLNVCVDTHMSAFVFSDAGDLSDELITEMVLVACGRAVWDLTQ